MKSTTLYVTCISLDYSYGCWCVIPSGVLLSNNCCVPPCAVLCRGGNCRVLFVYITKCVVSQEGFAHKK